MFKTTNLIYLALLIIAVMVLVNGNLLWIQNIGWIILIIVAEIGAMRVLNRGVNIPDDSYYDEK